MKRNIKKAERKAGRKGGNYKKKINDKKLTKQACSIENFENWLNIFFIKIRINGFFVRKDYVIEV